MTAINRAARVLQEADAIIVAAGAGMGVDSGLPDYRDLSREMAKEKGWEWEEMVGDSGLLKQLIEGPCPEGDFLVVEPGWKIVATNDEKVIGSVPVKT